MENMFESPKNKVVSTGTNSAGWTGDFSRTDSNVSSLHCIRIQADESSGRVQTKDSTSLTCVLICVFSWHLPPHFKIMPIRRTDRKKHRQQPRTKAQLRHVAVDLWPPHGFSSALCGGLYLLRHNNMLCFSFSVFKPRVLTPSSPWKNTSETQESKRANNRLRKVVNRALTLF